VALAASAAASAAPYSYVQSRRKRRLRKIEEQLPDALDSLSRALKAGYPFANALDTVSREATGPLGVELRTVCEERKLGMSWERAFENLVSRVPLQEICVFAAAVQLQNRTGGRLSEVLGQTAEGMRESTALNGEIRALSAHGRITGAILTALPVGVCILMAFVNPGFLRVLTDSPWGKHLLSAAAVSIILAHLIIRRIVAIRI
jgi:tight adherence protein B